MRNILHYDNLIVFDGMSGEFKVDISINTGSNTYERDLTKLATSKAVGLDIDRIVNKQDIVYHMSRWGTIIDTEYDNDEISLEIAFSSDMYQRKIFNLGSVNVLDDFEVDNRQPVSILLSGVHTYLNSSGEIAYCDEMFRQVMLKEQLIENCIYEDKKVSIELSNNDPIHIRHDEIGLKIIKEDFTESSVNELTLINEDQPLLYKTYYFNKETGVSEDEDNLDKPSVNEVMYVKEEEYTNIAVAKDFFKQQEYSSELVFSTKYPDDVYNENLYGMDVIYHKRDGGEMTTKVTAVKIQNGMIEFTLGTNRSKLEDILGGDK